MEPARHVFKHLRDINRGHVPAHKDFQTVLREVKQVRKILIRAGMRPTDNCDYIDMIRKNRVGSNIGNLVYQYSVCKTLMTTEDTEIVPTDYRYHFSSEEIDEFNKSFDCFVIPLADAFRKDFVREMRGMTKLIQALTIPCYVIGAGIKAPIGISGADALTFDFDEDAKAFVSAVLDHSALVGLRGQLTGDYLKNLGFVPEKDFTVIGCPSMYLNEEIKISGKIPTPDSDIAFNLSPEAGEEYTAFVKENARRFKSAVYIPQNVDDLKLMYAGAARGKRAEGFPVNINDPVFTDDLARFPDSFSSWNKLLKEKDFSFGTRLHGNIMGVLAGIPSLHIPSDLRTTEVVEYHSLTHVKIEEARKSRDIFDLIAKADFHSPERAQKHNFEHYLDFLNANGIRHIYLPGERRDILDRQVGRIKFREPLRPLCCEQPGEIVRRSSVYSTYANNRIKEMAKAKAKPVKDPAKAT